MSFLAEAVEPGSTLHTDGRAGYRPAVSKGYVHRVTILKGKKKSAAELMPRVRRIASLLKRWILGIHQGAISHEHPEFYLDDLTFRFNRRKSRDRGKLFCRLVQQAVIVDPVPYKLLVRRTASATDTDHHL